MQVGMAHTAEKDLHFHIARARFTALDGKRSDWRGFIVGGKGFCVCHRING
jgi:hypothetical protein